MGDVGHFDDTSALWDWPNAAGFQATHEQRLPVELKVIGKFPAAVAGTLLRTGPSTRTEGNFQLSHWFDGFSHVYRFQLIAQKDGGCKVVYNSRRQVDTLVHRVRQTGKLDKMTFGQRDPCKSLFAKLKQTFFARPPTSNIPDDANVGVTIHAPGVNDHGQLVTRTDSAQIKYLDMETLEPSGLTNQKSLHPDLSGPLSCAHPQYASNGDCFNYNLQFARFPTYNVFKTSSETGTTEILASITGPDVPPSYVHSFFLTENYVVLCIWTAHYMTMGLRTLWERNLLDAIAPFDENAKSHWFVIDRTGGRGLVKRFQSPAMFCFHTINAFEERTSDGDIDIIADLNEYPSLDILHRLYYDNLVSDGMKTYKNGERANSTKPAMARYRLASISTTGSWDPNQNEAVPASRILHLPSPQTGELPTINPSRSTLPYRYFYGLCDRGKSSFLDGITKTDLQEEQTKYWCTDKHTPGEPIFVRDPERSEKEDGGWLLSCVLDGERGKSYLLCLDAESMKEVGRAESEHAWGIGFHGTYLDGEKLKL